MEYQYNNTRSGCTRRDINLSIVIYESLLEREGGGGCMFMGKDTACSVKEFE